MTIFDTNRTDEHIVKRIGLTTPVLRLGLVDLMVADTGEIISAPIRMTYNSGAGLLLEIGPYSLEADDVRALHTALGAYLTNADWATGGSP